MSRPRIPLERMPERAAPPLRATIAERIAVCGVALVGAWTLAIAAAYVLAALVRWLDGGT